MRTRHRGLEVQERGKCDSSNRVISVPLEVLELPQRRNRSTEYVFPSVGGKLRDVGNFEADWRANRANKPIEWAPWGSKPIGASGGSG